MRGAEKGADAHGADQPDPIAEARPHDRADECSGQQLTLDADVDHADAFADQAGEAAAGDRHRQHDHRGEHADQAEGLSGRRPAEERKDEQAHAPPEHDVGPPAEADSSCSTPITASETATMIAIKRGSKVQLSEKRSWAIDRLKVASSSAVGVEREEHEHERGQTEIDATENPLTLLLGGQAHLQRLGRRFAAGGFCRHCHADHPVEIWPIPASSVLMW